MHKIVAKCFGFFKLIKAISFNLQKKKKVTKNTLTINFNNNNIYSFPISLKTICNIKMVGRGKLFRNSLLSYSKFISQQAVISLNLGETPLSKIA